MTDATDRSRPRALAAPAALCAALLMLAACNTTEGLGQDIENTGEVIEEEAEEAS